MPEGPAFYVYRDRDGLWRWALVTGTGQRVADTAEGYESRALCDRAVEEIELVVTDPKIHRHDSPPPEH
jgi:uncharacterized protein YegP (UPF0339 family)